MTTAGNAAKFLAAYNEIEAFIVHSQAYQQVGRRILPAINELAKTNRVIREYQTDLVQLVELRNAIVHRSTTLPIAEPYTETVEFTVGLKTKILRPKTVKTVASSPVISFQPSAKLLDVISKMNDENLTNIPIIDDQDKLLGVLSESTLVRWFASECKDDGVVSAITSVADMRQFFDTPDDSGENIYRFVGRNLDVYSVRDMFDGAMRDGKRLSAVFVTSNGKRNGTIEGIVTAWDLFKA